MVNFHSLKGYIMNGDKAIVRFRYDAGMLVEAEVLASKEYLPIEYKCKVSDLRATEIFMEDRVIPSTRQHLQPELEKIGLKYYDAEALIRYNKGMSIEDDYWIQVDDEEDKE